MRLVYLSQCGQSGTPLGKFLGAVMRGFKPQNLIQAVRRAERNLGYLYKGDANGKKNSMADLARRRKFAIQHFQEIRSLARRSGLRASYMAATSNIETLRQRNYVSDRHTDFGQHLQDMVGT